MRAGEDEASRVRPHDCAIMRSGDFASPNSINRAETGVAEAIVRVWVLTRCGPARGLDSWKASGWSAAHATAQTQ